MFDVQEGSFVVVRKQKSWFVERNFTSLRRLLLGFCFTSFPLMSFREKKCIPLSDTKKILHAQNRKTEQEIGLGGDGSAVFMNCYCSKSTHPTPLKHSFSNERCLNSDNGLQIKGLLSLEFWSRHQEAVQI